MTSTIAKVVRKTYLRIIWTGALVHSSGPVNLSL